MISLAMGWLPGSRDTTPATSCERRKSNNARLELVAIIYFLIFAKIAKEKTKIL
jgi:hypothetical protein